MLCIDQRSPPSAMIQCFHCHADCPSGKRRRDPYGTWYCDPCGWKIQKAVRDAVQNHPELAYFVVAIPGFLLLCINKRCARDKNNVPRPPRPQSVPPSTPCVTAVRRQESRIRGAPANFIEQLGAK